MVIRFLYFFIFVLLICFSSIFEWVQAQSVAIDSVKSTQILQTKTTWNGKSIEYPNPGSEEITALEIEFAPGAKTTWHRHPVPSLAYILNGELEVILRDSGERKVFRQGDAFAEVIDTWHYGENVGEEAVKIVVFYIGEEGIQLTELLPESK